MVAIGDRNVAVGAEVEPEVPPIYSSERSNQSIRCLSELRNRTVVIKVRIAAILGVSGEHIFARDGFDSHSPRW